MKQTLLEKAKAVPIKNRRIFKEIDLEELDLVIAWLNDEVSINQVHAVIHRSRQNLYQSLTPILRWGVRQGHLKITRT
mgnify:CR=1 FL=1